MSLSHRFTTSVRTNAGTISGISPYDVEGTAESNIELEDHAIGTNTAQDFTADVSTIVSLVMLWSPATGSSTATIKTNSSSVPDDTITLVAGKPLIWNTTIEDTLGTTCPLTADVTGLFLTTTAIGDLSIYCLTSGS